MQVKEVSKKILCVGPYRSPSNAWRRVLTLKQMNYFVESLDYNDLGLFSRRVIFYRVVMKFAQPMARLFLSIKLKQLVRNFKPDLIFFDKCPWLTSQSLRKLRAVGSRNMVMAHYNPDDPFGEFAYGWNDFLKAVPEYDVHFIPKEVSIPEYEQYGARRVYVFDRSYDPSLHFPYRLNESERLKYSCDIGFIGSWAPHREKVIAELIQSGIKVAVWGDGWSKGQFKGVIYPHWCGGGQFNEDYSKAISGMKIALHFLRRENRDEQDSRTFEIPACGTFMLGERSPAHENLFIDGEEAVFFDPNSVEDLKKKIAYYMANPDERECIAKRGLARCQQSGYDHESRMKELLQFALRRS